MNAIKKSHVLCVALLAATSMSVATSASAASFFRTGTIVRTLTDSAKFGGCMVQLSTLIANGCPNEGWVSLDCAGIYAASEDGRQAYSSALVAVALGKNVTVKVNNAKTVTGGYCVATRLDIRL